MNFLGPITSLLLSILAISWIGVTNSEPVQYCKFGSSSALDVEIDFCMGALIYQNASSDAHDMYLTLRIPRLQNSALGWTAIGLGTIMEGSLMFIVYGDPLSHEDPIVSIRTANGHHQPTLLTQEDMPDGMDLRVIRSSWLSSSDPHEETSERPSYGAWVSLVCYSCHLWRGTEISAQAKSQPWIWAWNGIQKFDVFSYDAHLDMHKHHAGAGGWGNFYVDMSSSISSAKWPPSLPPIRPIVASLGASDIPTTFASSLVNMIHGPGSYFHGLILTSVFLVFFPAGIVGLRVGFSKSSKYHWMLQTFGSVFLLSGVGLGLLKSRKLDTFHQWAGISLAFSVGLQGSLGWWHHKRFVKVQRRTWVSHFHIWLGRLVLLVGWSNVVSGLSLRGYERSSAAVVTVLVIVCLEGGGLVALTFWKRKHGEYATQPAWAKVDDESFGLTSIDDEEGLGEEHGPKDEKDETADLDRPESIGL